MGTELQNVNDDLDNMLAAFDSDNVDDIMKMTGQSTDSDGPRMGLPRLSINYDSETDDGLQLKRGAWKVWNGSALAYSDTVQFRPLLRTYEWSVWDQEDKKFSCKSIQKTGLKGEFPDSLGGNKCGRLSKEEEQNLDDKDPRLLLSRSVSCNQVIYGIMDAPDATLADGTPAPIENMAFVAYFKRSGFVPVREFMESLTRRKVIAQKAVVEMTTEKHKMGSVLYWTPKLSMVKEVGLTDEDKALIKKFTETIKGHNESVMADHQSNTKASMSPDDIDLSARLAG